MTLYERLDRIKQTYINNATACYENGMISAYNILLNDANILGEFIESMPIGIADMYAGENE